MWLTHPSGIIFCVFIASLILQFFCLFLLFLPLYWHKTKTHANPQPFPVSIIVCVHNELDNLKNLLNSLQKQNHPCFEIVVVNDRSDQEMYSFLYFLKKNQPGIKVVTIDHNPEKFSPKKYALFLGIKAASHEHLLFTDADCIPSSDDWITQMQSSFIENKQMVLGFSPVKKYPGLLNHFIRYETLYTAMQYLGFAKMGMPYMGVGRNLSYTKSLFLKGQGFVNHIHILGGDDDLFVNEHGTGKNSAIQIHPASHVFTEPKHTFSEWFIQKKRHLTVGFYYRFLNKLKASFFPVSDFFMIMTGFILIIMNFMPGFIFWALTARYLCLTIISALVIHRLKDNTRWFLVPLFDFIYLFYFLTMGFLLFNSRKIKWK